MLAELSSWTDSVTKAELLDFVNRVTEEGGPHFVEPSARIAVFDNDGTLWCEKPMPIQLDFTIRRFAEMARHDSALQRRQPWKAAHERDMRWLEAAMVKHYHGDDGDLKVLMDAIAQAFGAVKVEDYQARVAAFFDTADHPILPLPYRSCGYTPMVDLIRYLEANRFATYITSGGDRDFMRPIAEKLYGIPPERIIGSTLGLIYQAEGGRADLQYQASMDFLDDGPEKPVRIWSRIGRRPILSVGNSNGDLPMLSYSGSQSASSLQMLILHDDADREFEYVAGAERALRQAQQQEWTVVSMKNDWDTVFEM